jgi:hypothetical protein
LLLASCNHNNMYLQDRISVALYYEVSLKNNGIALHG